MAENPKTNTGILAKAQKRLSRTKTKVLQNLGKAEKTKDETFNTNVVQIEELQETTHPLQKELNNYLHCVKNLSQASKRLHTSLQNVYEDDWADKQLFQEQMQNFDLLWNDYIQNFQDSVVGPMNSYLHHFPALKTKISKRGRKLVDYDNTRHHLEVLQAAKKKDELKIEKADEEMKEAKKIYEELNHELLVEMPAFYNSRVHFFSTLFTSLFGAEFVFHSEVGKINATVGDSCQKLANESEPMTVKLNTSMSVISENGTRWESSSGPPTPIASSPRGSDVPSSTDASGTTEVFYTNQAQLEEKQAKRESTEASHMNGGGVGGDDKDDDDSDSDSENQQPPEYPPQPMQNVFIIGNGSGETDDNNYVNEDAIDGAGDSKNQSVSDDDKDDDDEGNVYEEPLDPISPKNGTLEKKKVDDDDEEEEEDSDDAENDDANVYSQTPSNRPVYTPPPGTLYQVEATHRYTGEDVDELNFEPGETIYVVSFDIPDEQDDGWQMGIKQSDGIKGVFPENFTKKI